MFAHKLSMQKSDDAAHFTRKKDDGLGIVATLESLCMFFFSLTMTNRQNSMKTILHVSLFSDFKLKLI